MLLALGVGMALPAIPVLARSFEVGFGLAIGILSMLGDLAESLIKRDSGRKDASQLVPGFGGVLDVVEGALQHVAGGLVPAGSLVFAAGSSARHLVACSGLPHAS